jgi:hypothetical protein
VLSIGKDENEGTVHIGGGRSGLEVDEGGRLGIEISGKLSKEGG